MMVVKFGLRIARQEDKDFEEAELWLMSLLPHDSGSLYPKIPTAVYTAIMVIFRSLAKARLAKSHNRRPVRGYQADLATIFSNLLRAGTARQDYHVQVVF